MRQSPVNGLAVAVSFACALSCAQATYDGHRSADEVAKLITTDAQAVSGFSTEIVAIDDKEMSGTSFKLLPGRHNSSKCSGLP